VELFRQALHLADVLPAEETISEATSEAAASDPSHDEETSKAVSEAAYVINVLKTLPVHWRRALLLAKLDALDIPAITEVLDVSQTTVTVWIDQASAFVSAHLVEAGISLADHEHPLQILRDI